MYVCMYSCMYVRTCVHKEGKKMLQTFQRKMNEEYCKLYGAKERRTDESSNKKEYQNKGTRGSGSQSAVELGRPCGKNGPA